MGDAENFNGLRGFEKEVREYVQQLHNYRKIFESHEKEQQRLKAAQQTKQANFESSGKSVTDLPQTSFARQCVEKLGLVPKFFDAGVSEAHWKTYQKMRAQMEDELRGWENASFESSELYGIYDEDDAWDTGEGEVTSLYRLFSFLTDVRVQFEQALRSGGVSRKTAKLAAEGLFLKRLYVGDNGDGDPRTVNVDVRIFSCVANAKVVDLEFEHHDRARMSFFEKFAHVHGCVLEPSQLSAAEQNSSMRAKNNYGGPKWEKLFNLDCNDNTGNETASLGTGAAAKRMMGAVLGDEKRLSDRKAFCALFRAAGLDVDPSTQMSMMRDPIKMYRQRMALKTGEVATDGELPDKEDSDEEKAGGGAGAMKKSAPKAKAGAKAKTKAGAMKKPSPKAKAAPKVDDQVAKKRPKKQAMKRRRGLFDYGEDSDDELSASALEAFNPDFSVYEKKSMQRPAPVPRLSSAGGAASSSAASGGAGAASSSPAIDRGGAASSSASAWFASPPSSSSSGADTNANEDLSSDLMGISSRGGGAAASSSSSSVISGFSLAGSSSGVVFSGFKEELKLNGGGNAAGITVEEPETKRRKIDMRTDDAEGESSLEMESLKGAGIGGVEEGA